MAQMNTSFTPSDLYEDLLCCAICYEPFNDDRVPKALPCLHTYCSDCLQKTIMAHKRSRYRQSGASVRHFPCPICKDDVRIPSNGLDGFRDDFRVRRMSEVLNQTRNMLQLENLEVGDPLKDDEDEEVPVFTLELQSCEVCRFFNKESQAPLYCLECNKRLCRSCSEKHLNTSIAKDHKIVSGSEALPSNTTCKLHASEPLKYFCRQCSKPVCMTCTLTEEHSSHDVILLSEHSDNIKKTLDNLVTSVMEKIPQLETRSADFENIEKRLVQKEQRAHRAVLSRTFEEITRAKNNQAKMESELKSICKQKHKNLQAQWEAMKNRIRDMQELCEFTRTVIERGQDLQVVGAHEEVSEKLTKMLATSMPSPPDITTFTNIRKYDALAEATGNSAESGENTEDSITQATILAEIKSVVVQMRLFSQGKLDLKVEPVKVIGRKGSEDGEFNFPSAVTIFSNGDLAVADMHNNRVQVFDINGNFKRKFGHDGFKPCGIAVTKDGNIAVTDCKSHVNCIKIFTQEGEQKRQIGMGEFDYPFSLAVDSKGHFIVSDPAVSRVTILYPNGTVKTKFSTKSKFTFYVTVNSKDEILVSDWYHHHVKVFDQKGKLLRTIGTKGSEDGQLLIPLGIACDMKDNVIVLDCKCERVSMFTAHGQFLQHLIGKSEGIEHSRAMALSHEGHLVVTHGDNKRDIPNEVRVYQM